MKRILLILALLFTAIGFSQAPEKMSYQAIIRDANDNLLSNKSIGLQISILQNTATGKTVYLETHNPTTNINGLITIEIGTGSEVSGVFSQIDWSSGNYFIKSETDPLGGTNYSISGTSQLLSVPYALHAKTAENFSAYKIGDVAHGGIVFWVDESGQHGLVFSANEISDATKWFAGTFGSTQAKGNGVGAGKANSSIIISSHVFLGDDGELYAARLCNELEVVSNNVIYGDWYLPSVFELKLMSLNVATLNATTTSISGDNLSNNFYWSSTEASNSMSKIVNPTNGQESSVLKGSLNRVRAVRTF
tara:strand:- start:2584 stop:3501 length:918 start_codon:yes stop_codon:yes gene_type:complete